jgi:hypothetical protein
MEEMGWTDEDEGEQEVVTTKEKITQEQNEEIKSITSFDGQDYRGIRKETNVFFGVRYEYDEETGKPFRQYVPTTIDGELAGYKTRTYPKDFSYHVGITGADCDMIGEFRFKTHKKMVLIVGGEIKMLTAYQMLEDNRISRGKDYDSVAVVSPSIGESGAYKQVQKRYEFFNQFEKIIVCMDADEAGEEATEKICAVLPKGKAFVMKMRHKDADTYIAKNDERAFITDFWNARPWVPAGIVGSGDLGDKMLAEAALKKIPFPEWMHELNTMTAGGVGLGRIVNIGAASGIGKTTIVDTLVYHWAFNSPYLMGVVSMELNAGQYGLSMLSRHIKRKISNIISAEEKVEFLQQDWVKDKQRELFFREDGSHRLFVVDERDGTLEALQSVVEELVIRLGVKVIVLDPIQDILDGLDNEQQAVFMKWQKGLVKSHGVTFFNINHVRKSGNGSQSNSSGGMISEEDFAGSSTIFKSASLNILLVRNKMAEDPIERNTTYIYVSKNRDNGLTGPAGEFIYDNDTHQLMSKEAYMAAHGTKVF